MSRPKKDRVYLNIKVTKDIYNRLAQISEEAGQTKTLIVERALVAYFKDYEEKQAILLKEESSSKTRCEN